MKWITRPLAFALCIFLGVFAATEASSPDLRRAYANVPDPTEQMGAARFRGGPQPADAPKGIDVVYAGFIFPRHGTPYLRFIVHNGDARPVHYEALSSDHTLSSVLVNDVEQPLAWECWGAGPGLYFIPPGASTELRVYPQDLSRRPRTRDSVKIGFHLQQPGIDISNVHYSEPFRLPREFINAIDEFATRSVEER